jgi:hypothetical protein
MEQFQNPTDFSLKSVAIAPLGETKGYEIKQMVNSFSYVESITSPFVAATLTVADSAGLINDLPIQGGETVKVVVQTSSKEDPDEYVLQVWKVGNRMSANNAQAYTLGLVSVEALNNECVRLVKPIDGKPEEVVKKILAEDLKSTKKVVDEINGVKAPITEYKIKMLPTYRRPFDIISSIAVKSVEQGSSSPPGNSKKVSGGKNETAKISGTAGYFFWESKRGYNFFSVDSLVKPNKENTWGPYVEKIANQSDGADDRFVIAQATFNAEVDVLNAMRKGKYSSLLVFFNHSTGQYAEYHYSLEKAYKEMKHLGAQNTPSLIKFGDGDKTIADYPTRIISTILDHESWYNDAEIASYEQEDESGSPSEFCDFHKHYAAQSLMRYELLKQQQGTIVIPGNSEICAGDKIDIRLVNKAPGDRITEEPWDTESSGIYLIQEVTHTYNSAESTNGRFLTTLRLMRDSYGQEESNHGTK